MSLFCKHQWVDISWSYTPPAKHITYPSRMWGDSAHDFLDKLDGWLMGRTVLLQRCSVCNKAATREYDGRVSPDGVTLVEPARVVEQAGRNELADDWQDNEVMKIVKGFGLSDEEFADLCDTDMVSLGKLTQIAGSWPEGREETGRCALEVLEILEGSYTPKQIPHIVRHPSERLGGSTVLEALRDRPREATNAAVDMVLIKVEVG
jgi:hypothetical protein